MVSFVAFDRELLVAVDEVEAFAAFALEIQLEDRRPGHHRQIRPVRHRAQEGVGRAPAPAALLVHLEVGAAEVVAAVEHLDRRDAALGRRRAPGVDDLPAYARVLDAHLAAGAVAVDRAVLIVFQGKKQGQDFVPRPSPVAERGPVVPVLFLAAHVDHGVDRRAAAEHAAARIVDRAPGEVLVGLGLVAPVGARVGDGVEVADRDVDPEPVVPPPGFQQKDFVLRTST